MGPWWLFILPCLKVLEIFYIFCFTILLWKKVWKIQPWKLVYSECCWWWCRLQVAILQIYKWYTRHEAECIERRVSIQSGSYRILTIERVINNIRCNWGPQQRLSLICLHYSLLQLYPLHIHIDKQKKW